MIRRVWEDWKAKRRGEVRVAPGLRGRVYARKEDRASGGGSMIGLADSEATISARVYRAATGEWEDLGVIAEPNKD